MKQKKLMLLGGSHYLLPAIEAAHKLGVYVITCDYLPDNYAHRFSDEYHNISVIDKEAVLAKAQELEIDGILGFANDAGVVPAAYVATKMGLPTPPLRSVEILQNKDMFRDFLSSNGFNCPWHKNYSSVADALADANTLSYPCIVKPVDSCGSKGVTMVKTSFEFRCACEIAAKRAFSGRFIVEQFLEPIGHQSGSDCFSIDNELVFCSFDSQYFDPVASNQLAPIAHIWPSDMQVEAQNELRNELQRLIKLLNMGTTIYNVEARVSTDGKPYIMEVSPRSGGNRLSEVLNLATGQDLITNNVRYALGLPLETMSNPNYDGVWVDYVIHSQKHGRFESVSIDPVMKHANLKELCIYVENGDYVDSFTGANKAIGTAFLRFDSYIEADEAICHANEWLKIKVL